MKKITFNKIHIIDLENSRSYSQEFIDGVNIITSSENGVGKSTIIKSLYYTLGAELKFGNQLHLNNILTVLEFEIDGQQLTIMRNRGTFRFIDNNENSTLYTSTSNLTKELSELFGYSIYLENANNIIQQAPPVFYYLPYYIDQLNGWQPSPLSFERLSHFNKDKRDSVIYYHLGIFNKEYGKMILEKDALANTKKTLLLDESNTLNLLEIIDKEITSFDNSLKNTDIILLNKHKQLKEYEKYSYQANNIKKELLSYKETLLTVNHTLKHLDDSIKSQTKKKFNISDIELCCPNCSEYFSISHSELFKINFQIEELNTTKLELIDQKAKLINKIELTEKTLLEFSLKLKEIEAVSNNENVSLKSIFEFKGLEHTKNKLYLKLKSVTDDLVDTENNLKQINNKLRKIRKNKKSADALFGDLLEKYFTIFDVTDIYYTKSQKEKTMPSTTFSSTGASQIKINLSKLYATIELINRYNKSVYFPIVIDSPKSGEQSFKNNKTVLKNIIYNISFPNQTIVATIEYPLKEKNKEKRSFKLNRKNNKFKNPRINHIRLINLTNSEHNLLSNKHFVDNHSVINSFIKKFTES